MAECFSEVEPWIVVREYLMQRMHGDVVEILERVSRRCSVPIITLSDILLFLGMGGEHLPNVRRPNFGMSWTRNCDEYDRCVLQIQSILLKAIVESCTSQNNVAVLRFHESMRRWISSSPPSFDLEEEEDEETYETWRSSEKAILRFSQSSPLMEINHMPGYVKREGGTQVWVFRF